MARRLHIEGDRELLRTLKRMRLKTSEEVKAIRPAAKLIQSRARALVPVDEGLLQKSIKLKRMRGAPAAIAVLPEYRKRVSKKTGKTLSAGFHAHLVEWGTRFAAAQPFMRPAFVQTGDAAQRQLLLGLWDLVKRKARAR